MDEALERIPLTELAELVGDLEDEELDDEFEQAVRRNTTSGGGRKGIWKDVARILAGEERRLNAEARAESTLAGDIEREP